MGIFDRFKKETAPNQMPVDTPATGTINLVKGSRVSLAKNDGGAITVTNGWTAQGKDYDLKALVRYHDGHLVYVGAANRDEILRTKDGAVQHSGDARKAGELETLTIKWHPQIASIAISSYSALENGPGSFREYGVYTEIKNGGQVVRLNAADASADSNQYTCCFGEVLFEPGGTMTIVNLERYSARGSERRVGYRGATVTMDIGPAGQNK